MANTLSGPYTPNTWTEGVSDLGSTRMSHLETQAGVALGSINPDLVASGFVLSGAQATRHNSYSAAVLADAPDRYYRLDETSGATAVDSGAAQHSLFYVAAPTLGVVGALTGDPDTAITLNGTTQYAYNGVSSDLPSGAQAFSIECWIKTGGGVLQDFLMFGDYDTGNHNVLLQWTSANFVKVFSNGGTAGVTSDAALSLNTWHHIVATYDGATLLLFIDGVQQSTSATVTLALAYVGAYPLVIGATSSGATHTTPIGFFNGSIDEAALYVGAALSSTRISAHYTAGTTATTQVDIASGVAYLIQSDGSLARCAIGATSEITSALSSTYFLYLQPDGSWYWSTIYGPAANSLEIATVTTDGSGNVSVVHDLRPMTISLFGGAAAGGIFPRVVASATRVQVTTTTSHTILSYRPPSAGVYRLSAYLYFGNSSAEKPLLGATWYDPLAGTTSQQYFIEALNGTLLSGAQAIATSAGVFLATFAMTVYASTAGNITITYQDGAGSPSDMLAAVIEQLA